MTHMTKGTDAQKVKQDIQNSLQGASQGLQGTSQGQYSGSSLTSSLSGTNPQEVRNQIQQSLGNQAGLSLSETPYGGATQSNKVRQEVRKDLNQK